MIGADCPPILVTGGSWWLADEVQRAVAQADRFGSIRFLGSVADSDMPALYEHATVVCHPSLGKGFGFSCLEALGYGRPLVASDLPSIREMATGAAVLVTPGDPEALANGLTRVLGDDAEQRRLSAAGPPVAADYSWEGMAATVVERYRIVIDG